MFDKAWVICGRTFIDSMPKMWLFFIYYEKMALIVHKLTWVTCERNCIDSMPKMWMVFYLLQKKL